jgi:Zn-dependent protease
MAQKSRGSIRLFNIVGIDVFLHWSWFLVAVFEVERRAARYSSILWNVLEYFSLFLIVLLHEFGHSLACRQTGGQADHIVLWPLGGIAFVSPPLRPGAMLWSVSAGPLVNLALFPVTSIILLVGRAMNLPASFPNVDTFFHSLWLINLVILIFNLLPIYPLDGGQILQSLLWFVFGRVRSLAIVAVFGFIGVGGVLLLALWARSFWLIIIAAFILLNCWGALLYTRKLSRLAKAPRRMGYACPSCSKPPPIGLFWICSNCRRSFDMFGTSPYSYCPRCRAASPTTTCPECNKPAPTRSWITNGREAEGETNALH